MTNYLPEPAGKGRAEGYPRTKARSSSGRRHGPGCAQVPAMAGAALPDILVDAGQIEEGLPDNRVTSLAPSADGDLWVGTQGGLVRFDGVRLHPS